MPTRRRTPAPAPAAIAGTPFNLFSGTLHQLIDKLKTCNPDRVEEFLNRAWVGTEFKSLDHACSMFENGDPKLLSKYKQIEQKNFKSLQSFKPVYQPSTEGLYFSIPAFLEGEPEHWLSEELEPTPTSNGDIYINISVSGATDIEAVMKKLINIVALIDNAEASGQRLNIYLCTQMKRVGQQAGDTNTRPQMEILIKRDSEPVNLQQLIYLVATPVILRFAYHIIYAELEPKKYGQNAQDSEEERRWMKRQDIIYIPSIYYDQANYIDNYTDLKAIYPHLKDKI